jgi:drug/metabolite transporter (DMT)-like permease
MDDAGGRDLGRLALAVGCVAAGSAVCLATYFAVRGPFGSINDVGNAATGVLSAALAWRFRRQVVGGAGEIAVAAAAVGAAFTVVGSSLVLSGTTGFFLAGLVSSVGFAGIGTWLVTLNRGHGLADRWPRWLRSLGILAGVLMMVGIVAVPGILLGLDDMDTAPGWIWIAFVGWLGTFVVFPAWAIAISVIEARDRNLLLDRV